LGRPGLEPGTNALKERGEIFYGLFLRSGKIWLQNGAILRNTVQTALVRMTYEKHAMQRYENLRNSLGLNYETVALPAELRRREAGKTLHPAAVHTSALL
jgi:hypothetical protein